MKVLKLVNCKHFNFTVLCAHTVPCRCFWRSLGMWKTSSWWTAACWSVRSPACLPYLPWFGTTCILSPSPDQSLPAVSSHILQRSLIWSFRSFLKPFLGGPLQPEVLLSVSFCFVPLKCCTIKTFTWSEGHKSKIDQCRRILLIKNEIILHAFGF